MEPKEGPPPPPTSPPRGGGEGGGGAGGGGGAAPLRLGAKPGAATGSATTTMVAERVQQEAPVLRLTLEPRPHIRWDERVVDNEHMNKRSSKRCCIFHKKRAFGESSSESDSSDDDDDDDGSGGEGEGGGSDGGEGKGKGEGKKQDRNMRIAQPKHPPVRPWETYHA